MYAHHQTGHRSRILWQSVQPWLWGHRLRTAKTLVALGLAATITPQARGADRVWLGAGTNADWFNAANWSLPVVPGSGDTANFSNTTGSRARASLTSAGTVGAIVVSENPVLLNDSYGITGSGHTGLNIGTLIWLKTPVVSTGDFVLTDLSVGVPTALIDSQQILYLTNSNLGATTITLNGGGFVTGGTQSFLASTDVTMTGASSMTFNTGAEAILNNGMGSGSLTITGAGTLTIGGGSVVINRLTMTGAGSINLNSGTLIVVESAVISSGTFTRSSGGDLRLGTGGFGGSLTIQNSGVFRPNGGFATPGASTISVLSGGKIIADSYFDVGNGATGTLVVSGGASSVSALNNSDWGRANGRANVTFLGSGVGTYLNLQLGTTGGIATLTLNSSAQLNVTNSFLTDRANLMINSGTLNSSTGVSTFGGQTSISLAGGMLSLGNASFQPGSSVIWTSGGIQVAPTKTLNVNGATITNTSGGIELSDGATYKILRDAGTGTAGVFTNSSYFDIARLNNSGTLIVDGVGSRVTTGGTIVSDWAPGTGKTAIATFSNSGAGTYAGGLTMATSGGTTIVNLRSGGQLNTASLTTGSTSVGSDASITINGGMLNSMGTANFRGGTQIIATAGTLALGGNTTISTGALVSVTNTATLSLTSGTTLDVSGGSLLMDVIAGTIPPNAFTLSITRNGNFGGHLTSNNYFDLAGNVASGTLLVDGLGSFINIGADSHWGHTGGNNAVATFSNSGVGTYGMLSMSVSGAGGGNGKTTLTLATDGELNTSTVLLTGNPLNTASVLINIAGGTLNSIGTANFRGGTTINLSSGGLKLNDATFSANSRLNWSGGTVQIGTGKTLTFDGGMGSFTVGAGFSNSTISISSGTLAIAGNATLGTNSTVNYSSGSIGIIGTLDMSSNSKVLFTSGSNKTMRVNALNMTGTSKIDLADNTLSIFYAPGPSPLATIRGYLQTGYANGPWTGNALTSSTAAAASASAHKIGLGYTDNFLGLPILVVLDTYFGDANLDGAVNALDFNALATHFGQTNKFWTDGDFDYNGTVNTADFTALAANFNQLLFLPAPPLGALVPEPASIGIFNLMLQPLLSARRRRSDAIRIRTSPSPENR